MSTTTARRRQETQPAGLVQSIAARRGTQREYETVLILRPQVSKTDIRALVDRMREIFGERQARVLKIDNWGIRILAYPIAHCTKGVYLYWRYLGGSDIVQEFERHLRNNDLVIRFYTVKVDEDVDPDARPSEVTDDLLEQVSEPGPDPDELRAAAEEEEEDEEEQFDEFGGPSDEGDDDEEE